MTTIKRRKHRVFKGGGAITALCLGLMMANPQPAEAALTPEQQSEIVALVRAELKNGLHPYLSINSSVTGDGSNYNNDGATGKDSMALGVYAKAPGNTSVAIGYKAQAQSLNNIAIGTESFAQNGLGGVISGAIAIGYQAKASDNDTIAFGARAQATTSGSTAVGRDAKAGTGNNATAYGYLSNAQGTNATALGMSAQATASSAVALGSGTKAFAQNASALGQWLTASGVRSVAVGFGVQSTAVESIGIGTSSGTGSGHIVTQALGVKSIAIGSGTRATGENAIAFGRLASAAHHSDISIGDEAGLEADMSYSTVFLGKGAGKGALKFSTAPLLLGSVLIGVQAGEKSVGDANLMMGHTAGAFQNGSQNIFFGTYAGARDKSAPGNRNVIIGTQQIHDGETPTGDGYVDDAIAIGTQAQAQKAQAIAIGRDSSVTSEGGIALGAGSVGDRAEGSIGYDPATGVASTKTSPTWVANTSALSVGNSTTKRQITNVAAGTEDTDVVNVAQLKTLSDRTVKYDGDTKDIVTLGGAESTTPVTLNNVASAGTLSDPANAAKAVNAADVNTALKVLNDKGLLFAANEGAAVTRKLGETLTITGGAKTAGTYSSDNIKTVADPTTGVVTVQVAASPKFGSIVINDGGKITGLTNGIVGAGSKDAITGDQLHKTNAVVSGNATALGATYDVTTGNYTAPVYNITDASGNPTTTSNVKDALEALNRGHSMTIAASEGTATGALLHSVKAGSTVTFTAGRNIELTQNHGNITIATKNDAIFSSLAVGPVKINEGNSGKITGLEAGAADADAVTVKQLKESIANAIHANHTTIQSNSPVSYVSSGDNKQLVRIIDASTGDVSFYRPEDINATTGQPNPGAAAYTGDDIVLAALSGGKGTQTTVAVRMKNVAAGIENHDAVNVTQLKGMAKALGGGADVNADGTIKQPSYSINGVEKTSVGDALAALDVGWNLKAAEGDLKAIKAGNTVTVAAGDNMVVTHADGTITYGTSKTPSFTSVTSDSYKVGANTYIDSNGINANEKAISNVADGTAENHAVNKKQLDEVDKKITDLNSTIGEASAWKLQVNGGNERTISKNSIINFQDGTHTTITASGNDVKVDLNDAAKASLTKADNSVQYDDDKTSITFGGTGNPAVALNNVASAGDLTALANANKAVNAGDVNKALSDLVTNINDKGLKFAANEGVEVTRKLDEILTIAGGAKATGTYSSDNIKTVTDATTGSITIQLAERPVFGTVVINDTGNTITGLGNKTLDLDDFGTAGRAATEEQLGLVKTKVDENASAISDLAGTVNSNNEASVKYDKKDDGSLDTGKVTLAGKDGTLLTNLKKGAINETSTDAVTGSQLHGTASSIADIIGGNAAVGADGKVTATDIGGTGANTIHGAIESINNTASTAMQGWAAEIDGAKVKDVNKANPNLNFVTGDNMVLTNEGGAIKIGTAKNVTFDTVTVNKNVTVGNTSITNEGLTIKDGPSVTDKGIDAGNKPLTNVGRSTDPNAAATVGQVNEAVGSMGSNWAAVSNRLHGMDRRISSVGAMAAAFSAMMPLDYDEANPTMFSVGFGHYSGQNAISLGVQHYANRDLLFNGGVAWSNDEKMFRLGATWRMGNSEKYETKRVSTTELKALRRVDELEGTVQNQQAVIEALEKRLSALEGKK